MDLHNKIGPLTTGNSDGAPPFHKGMNQVLDRNISMNVRVIYLEGCPLFNVAGSEFGMTIACNLDHLGKRFRARVKTACGITVGVVTLT